MKISKQRLKEIIKEEMSNISEEPVTDIAEANGGELDREALELKIEELENLIRSNYHRSALNDERIVNLAIKLEIDVLDLGGREGPE
jgi:hypothetical protein